MKISKLKNYKHKTVQYSLMFLVTLGLPACFQTNLLNNKSALSGKLTVVIMPEQTCADESNGRKKKDWICLGEKIRYKKESRTP